MQILVLGMHRSGTSAVVRLLNMMGAYLGPPDRVKGASPQNPKGFWENDDVVELDNRVLAAQRCLWNRLSEFDPDKLSDEKLATLRRRARDLIIRLDGSRPWAVKDPRMCLLLPFWRPLLEVPVGVLVNRGPLEVARSLQARNGIPLNVGIALWELHNLEALRGSLGLPRLLIQYADVVSDPIGSTHKLFEGLMGLGLRKLERPADDEVTAFIDPGLYHQKCDPQEQDEFLTPPQRRLYRALVDGSALNMSEVPPLSSVARETLRGYDTGLYAQADALHFKAMLDRREQELREVQKTLAESLETQKRLQTEWDRFRRGQRRVVRRDAEIGKALKAIQSELEQLNARIGSLETGKRDGRRKRAAPRRPSR